MVKRGKLEIIRDILNLIKNNRNSIKPTPLLRKSNLSSARFSEYLGELTEKGFVFRTKDSSENSFLSLTEKGFRFLEKYETMMQFIDEFEL